MRICGAKGPCRRHALLFAYEMLWNKSQKCSATDKLFGNSLSVVGTSAWRERRLSPIRCYGPNRLRLPRAAVVIEPVSDDSLRKTEYFRIRPETFGDFSLNFGKPGASSRWEASKFV